MYFSTDSISSYTDREEEMSDIKDRMVFLADEGNFYEACLVAGEYIKQLEEQIADMNDAYKVVMDEKCADDEIHCTCVPALRQQIKQLEDERRMYLDEKATFKEQVKQLEDMLKDIKNADKRFLQLFLVLASINIIFLVLLIWIYDDLKALEGKWKYTK